jgi:hypothetical protein
MNMRIARYLALGLGLFVLAALARDDAMDLARLLGSLSVGLFTFAAFAMVMAAWGSRG